MDQPAALPESATAADTPPQAWEIIASLLSEDPPDSEALAQFLASLSSEETALAISRLPEADRAELVHLLGSDQGANLIRDIFPEQAAGIIEDIEPAAAAGILEELTADRQADLLGNLSPDDADAILEQMAPAEAERAREILRYPADTAGGIMITEYLAFPEDRTVSEVLDDLRANRSRYSDYEVLYAYITDKQGILTGVLRMRDLLVCDPDVPLRDIMIRDPFFIAATTGLDQLTQIYKERHYLGIPVTAEDGRLVGVLRKSTVAAATERQTEKSFLRFSGIVGGEEFRSLPLRTRSLRRLAWLIPNIVLNILAASVIALYQDTIEAVIALAVFLPIVSDMSGCSGNQAVAVSMRELALGLLKPTEALRVFQKEIVLGLINGAVLGCLLGGAAFLWKGNLALAAVIGLALAANTLVSVLLGGLVPLLLKRLKFDPALASGPILTTCTDMCGFFLVLSLATVALSHLPQA